jgi:O-antigen/teichoic acid export membrane protein
VKQHLSNLGKQTLVYGVSAVALQAVGTVTLPVFTRAFSTSEYGALEITIVGLSAMLLVADLGLASASQRSYFDYTDEQHEKRRRVLATAIGTAMAAAVVLAGLIVAFREPLANWLFDGREYTTLLILTAVALPLSVAAKLLREVMRLHFQAWHYAASASLSAVVTGGLGVALVVASESGLDGVMIGVVVGNAVAVLYGLVVAARHVGVRFSRPELRIMLAYGLPLIPAAAALWGLSFLDRLMLGQLASLDAVGQYAVGGRFAMIVMFAVTAFGLAYSPFILSIWTQDREDEGRVRSRLLTYLTLVLTTTSVLLAVFAREAATVIAPGYDQAYQVVGILCLGVTLFGLSTITMTGISYMRRTRLFAAYSLATVGLNVVLNLVLIPPLGAFGAGLATCASYAALTVAFYVKSQRLYPTPYEPGKSMVVLLVGAAVMALGLLPLGLGYVAIKLAGLAAFAVAVVAFGVFDPQEIAEVRATLGRLSPRAPRGVRRRAAP